LMRVFMGLTICLVNPYTNHVPFRKSAISGQF
jgi:hypothetical protein